MPSITFVTSVKPWFCIQVASWLERQPPAQMIA